MKRASRQRWRRRHRSAPTAAERAEIAARHSAGHPVVELIEGFMPTGDPNAEAGEASEILCGPEVALLSPEKAEIALAEALARGRAHALEVLKRSDMLLLADFARRLGISRSTANRWRLNGRVLAVSVTGHQYRYPAWQLDERDRLLAGLDDVIAAAGNGWPAFLALERHYTELGGTGLSALRAGRTNELLRIIGQFTELFG